MSITMAQTNGYHKPKCTTLQAIAEYKQNMQGVCTAWHARDGTHACGCDPTCMCTTHTLPCTLPHQHQPASTPKYAALAQGHHDVVYATTLLAFQKKKTNMVL